MESNNENRLRAGFNDLLQRLRQQNLESGTADMGDIRATLQVAINAITVGSSKVLDTSKMMLKVIRDSAGLDPNSQHIRDSINAALQAFELGNLQNTRLIKGVITSTPDLNMIGKNILKATFPITTSLLKAFSKKSQQETRPNPTLDERLDDTPELNNITSLLEELRRAYAEGSTRLNELTQRLVEQNDRLLRIQQQAAEDAARDALRLLEQNNQGNPLPPLPPQDGNPPAPTTGGWLANLLGLGASIALISTKFRMLSDLLEGGVLKALRRLPFVDTILKVFDIFKEDGLIARQLARFTGLFSGLGDSRLFRYAKQAIEYIKGLGNLSIFETFPKIVNFIKGLGASFGRLGGMLRLGKALPVIGQVLTGIQAVYDGFMGFGDEATKKLLDKQKVDYRDKFSSAAASAFGGLVGIVDSVAGLVGLDTTMPNGKNIGENVSSGLGQFLAGILHPMDTASSIVQGYDIFKSDITSLADKTFASIKGFLDAPFDNAISYLDEKMGTDLAGFTTDIFGKINDLWTSIGDTFNASIKALANAFINNVPDMIIPDSVYAAAGRNPDGTVKTEASKQSITNPLKSNKNIERVKQELPSKIVMGDTSKSMNINNNVAAPVTNHVNASTTNYNSTGVSAKNDDRTFNTSNGYFSSLNNW